MTRRVAGRKSRKNEAVSGICDGMSKVVHLGPLATRASRYEKDMTISCIVQLWTTADGGDEKPSVVRVLMAVCQDKTSRGRAIARAENSIR